VTRVRHTGGKLSGCFPPVLARNHDHHRVPGQLHRVRYLPIAYAKRAGTSNSTSIKDAYCYILRMVLHFDPLKVETLDHTIRSSGAQLGWGTMRI
jgi:hypothetical protein